MKMKQPNRLYREKLSFSEFSPIRHYRRILLISFAISSQLGAKAPQHSLLQKAKL
ncbi:hypothetical protein ES702_06278 [subsurface metagenome]